MMNQAKCDAMPADVKNTVDELSDEFAAHLMGRGWDKMKRRGMAFMQASGVTFSQANPALVAAIKAKTAGLEGAWIQAVQTKGLQDSEQMLAEYRAEINKLEK
jgi:hypothetical protein